MRLDMLSKYLPKKLKSIHLIIVGMLPLVMMHPSMASAIIAVLMLINLFLLRGVAREEGKNGVDD